MQRGWWAYTYGTDQLCRLSPILIQVQPFYHFGAQTTKLFSAIGVISSPPPTHTQHTGVVGAAVHLACKQCAAGHDSYPCCVTTPLVRSERMLQQLVCVEATGQAGTSNDPQHTSSHNFVRLCSTKLLDGCTTSASYCSQGAAIPA